jgi:TRAP-type transport system periplasmic protein
MNRRRTLSGIAACTALAITPAAFAQQTVKLTIIAGHPPVFLWVKTVDEVFIPEVEKRLAGKVKIDWTKAWGGTLAKLGSESKAVADGIADQHRV